MTKGLIITRTHKVDRQKRYFRLRWLHAVSLLRASTANASIWDLRARADSSSSKTDQPENMLLNSKKDLLCLTSSTLARATSYMIPLWSHLVFTLQCWPTRLFARLWQKPSTTQDYTTMIHVFYKASSITKGLTLFYCFFSPTYQNNAFDNCTSVFR